MIWHVRWSYVLSKLYGHLRSCHTHFTWHMTDTVTVTVTLTAEWLTLTDRLSLPHSLTLSLTVSYSAYCEWKSTEYLLQMFTEIATENILQSYFVQMQWITILFLLLTGRWYPWSVFSDEEEVCLRSEPVGEVDTSAKPLTMLVRTVVLTKLVEGLCCTSCGCSSLAIRVGDSKLDLVSSLETYCTSCENVINSTLTSDRLGGQTAGNVPVVVNRSAVSATMDMGVGYSGLVKLCRYLDMDCMHHKTYATHVKEVAEANMVVTTKVLTDAAKVVRRVYQESDPSLDDDSVIDLTVTFDGSWMTRGHTSMYGIGCVIEVHTGLVLDLAVVSLYCQSCAHAKARYGGTHTAEYKKWNEQHTECNANYTGSSGGMEVVKLTAYYGVAIRAHPNNLDNMTDAVFATYYHAISSDDAPQHDRCPSGEDSWCFFKRAEATGETPGPHRDNVGTPLSPEVAPHVKEVYDRLDHPDLLRRCLRGQSQNANESSILSSGGNARKLASSGCNESLPPRVQELHNSTVASNSTCADCSVRWTSNQAHTWWNLLRRLTRSDSISRCVRRRPARRMLDVLVDWLVWSHRVLVTVTMHPVPFR